MKIEIQDTLGYFWQTALIGRISGVINGWLKITWWSKEPQKIISMLTKSILNILYWIQNIWPTGIFRLFNETAVAKQLLIVLCIWANFQKTNTHISDHDAM